MRKTNIDQPTSFSCSDADILADARHYKNYRSHFLDKEGQGDHRFSVPMGHHRDQDYGRLAIYGVLYRKRTWEAGSLEGRVSP